MSRAKLDETLSTLHSPLSMTPEYLNWNHPLLPTTVDFLIEKWTKDGKLDLRSVVLALPGRRAIHRLEEILTLRVEELAAEGKLDSAWYPPRCMTLGVLPEQFYELSKPIADDLTQRFAWIEAVDYFEDKKPEHLAKLLPQPPRRDDLEARLALGKMLANLHRELAADALDFSAVVEYCDRLHLSDEADRWRVLADIQTYYLERLLELGIWDLQSARLFAISSQKPEEFQRIQDRLRKDDTRFYLVGLVDMNQAQKEILKKFEDRIVPLVFAPESEAARFDEFGCLNPDAWQDVQISIDDRQIHLSERPTDQADAAIRCMAALDGKFSARQIVIGVPDPEVIPPLEQRLAEAGIESRHFEGTPLNRTAVYQFLDIVLRLLQQRSFPRLAELIRHPDVEDYVRSKQENTEEYVCILSELDRFHTDHLPHELSFHERGAVPPVHVHDLFAFDFTDATYCNKKEKPKVWTDRLEEIFARLYEDGKDRKDRLIEESLKKFRAAAETLNRLPEQLLPDVSLLETLELILLQLVSDNIPPHEKPNSVEMIGWLEIVMDDAPVVLVTGMNDGVVPSHLTSDMFLPDKVRQHLGIEDNRRRFARDAYSLSVILESRRLAADPGSAPLVHLIGGRYSTAGDPLFPSRLFFATDDETVAHRVFRYFKDSEETRPLILSKSLRPDRSQQSAFRVPELDPYFKPVAALGVSDFKSYLECPYRYFLKRRLRLNTLNDRTEELDALGFGNLVHEILQRFGQSDVKDSRSVTTIRDFLFGELQEYIREQFGETPRAAIRIQAERTQKRLEAFADWQAAWRAEGNVIEETEFPFNQDKRYYDDRISLDVDGERIYLKGRIDRIDRNEKSGRWIVLDYKTSGTATEPNKAHRKKNVEGVLTWTDLQLPLYHYILSRAGYASDMELGYVTLPKDVTKTGILHASWASEDLEDAVLEATRIASEICSFRFPKTDPPPPFSELFADICMDGVLT